MKFSIFIFFLFIVLENSGQVKPVIVIKDEQCAKEIANIIFMNMFGDSIVSAQMPLMAELKDSVWVVQGKSTVPDSDRIKLNLNNKNCKIGNIYPVISTDPCLIRDSVTAIKIASILWDFTFGEEISKYKPYGAILLDTIWIAGGSYTRASPEEKNTIYYGQGGAPQLKINMRDCTVIELCRGK